MMKYWSRCAINDTSVLFNCNAHILKPREPCTLLKRKTRKTQLTRPFSACPNFQSSKKSKPKRMTESKYIKIGDYNVFPWATSGLESAIVVTGPGKKDRIAFDMGYAHRETFNCSDIFISHGHMDHIAGFPSHASIRALRGNKPKPTYYIPTHLKEPLIQVLEGFSAMTEDNIVEMVDLKTVDPGDDIKLSSDRSIRVFSTIHRVKSQGYIIMRQYRTLKDEFKHLPGPEIGKLAKEGVQIKDEVVLPDLAYTGDSTFEIFLKPPDPSLLKVKLLITESTYIDDEIDKEGRGGQQRARERGHMHLQEFIDNAHLFQDVEKILLLHFSDKYSLGYLRDKVTDMLRGSLLEDKVIIGAIHKETFS